MNDEHPCVSVALLVVLRLSHSYDYTTLYPYSGVVVEYQLSDFPKHTADTRTHVLLYEY